MRLRRPYIHRVVILLLGALLLWGAVATAYLLVTEARSSNSWFGVLYAGLAVLFGLATSGWLVRHAVLPFRVDVDSHGWSIRTPKVNRHLRWDELAAVVLTRAAPATERRRGSPAPRLLLVPAAGVSLGVPLTERSPVDGRDALELFDLDEVDYGEVRFVRDLTALAGDRFHNLCAGLARPTGAVALRHFPDRADHARLTRWLDRRRALLFAAWYLLVLVPPLVLTVLATQLNEVLGGVVLVAGVVAIGAGTVKTWLTVGDCRDLAYRTAGLEGSDLVTGVGLPSRRTSLHSGTVAVLRPGTLTGYGKAWLLAHREHPGRHDPVLLLSDPRTGRLRSGDDLRVLAAALKGSPDESDRTAGRQLDELAAQALQEPGSGTPASDELPVSDDAVGVWWSVKALGRTLVLVGVAVTLTVAGGAVVEDTTVVGSALLLAAVALCGVWLMVALRATMMLLGALLAIVVRVFR